jgi:hypothetical protein
LFTALNDPVKDHCAKQNGKACQNALTNIGILKRFKDIFTKPFAPINDATTTTARLKMIV